MRKKVKIVVENYFAFLKNVIPMPREKVEGVGSSMQ